MKNNEVLIMPDKQDLERDQLAAIWKAAGGKVIRLGKFWEKPAVNSALVTLYGFTTFCFVLAELLDLELLSPEDKLIAEIDNEFLKRKIDVRKLASIDEIQFPRFIKPVNPKTFEAKVYQDLTELRNTIEGMDENELVLVSEIIEVEKEVRSFILNNKILDLAYYEGTGELETPKQFIERFLQNKKIELPDSFVLDIGFSKNLGWYIIEFNAAWGAGLNNCKPELVLSGIQDATRNV